MERNGTLDYARLGAAIGIVVFHVGAPGASIGYAGLPFFLILLVYLAFPAAVKHEFSDYAKAKSVRLLQPWIVWSFIYGVLKLAEVLVTGGQLSSEFAPWMLLTGPALHLWFLPFACAACISIWPLAHLSTRIGPTGLLACSATGLLFAAIIVDLSANLTSSQPVAQWLHALPAVLVGATLALINDGKQISWATATLLSALIFILLLLGWPPGSMQLVLACGALLLCLTFPLPSTSTTRSLADLALTVYLAHPIVISILLRTTKLAENSTVLAITAVSCTIMFALALRRLRILVTFKVI
jgi:surface polysaccharide O-acyltransferase-like enzyme